VAAGMASASSAASSKYGEGIPLPQDCGHACHTLPAGLPVGGSRWQIKAAQLELEQPPLRLHRASVVVA
jgi:hypothetical protein